MDHCLFPAMKEVLMLQSIATFMQFGAGQNRKILNISIENKMPETGIEPATFALRMRFELNILPHATTHND